VRVLSADHPDTLTARHNLAYWPAEAKDVAGWGMTGDRPSGYGLARAVGLSRGVRLRRVSRHRLKGG
jgi:hypothetical protein